MANKKDPIKILLTGGGSGGHIYPLLAVADQLIQLNKIVEISYIGPKTHLESLFRDRYIQVLSITSSKLRRYFNIANFWDIPKFIFSLFEALIKLYWLMPNIVFSKGGPGALAVVLAARFYFIPVIIHESDTIPGLTNRLSALLAKRIGITFPKTAIYFPVAKTFITGNPVRSKFLTNLGDTRKAKEYFGFNVDLPLTLVLGGSQGSTRINSFIINNLASLLPLTQIYHQVGQANIQESEQIYQTVFKELDISLQPRYKLIGYFSGSNIAQALNAADLIISRAGSGTIAEIAIMGKPSILIPLAESANNHQTTNAYEYAKDGAAIVIEEPNLKINILLFQMKIALPGPKKPHISEEIEKPINVSLNNLPKHFNPEQVEEVSRRTQENVDEKKYHPLLITGDFKGKLMSQAAKEFSKPDAAKILAEEILKLA